MTKATTGRRAAILLPFLVSGVLAAGLDVSGPATVVQAPKDVWNLSAAAGGRLAGGDSDEIFVWSPGPGRIEKAFPIWSSGAHLSPDGRLVGALEKGKAGKFDTWVYTLWEVGSWKKAKQFKAISDARFSPDGRKVALFQREVQDRVIVWDPATDEQKTVWEGESKRHETGSAFQPYVWDGVRDAAFSPDGKLLLVTRVQKGDDLPTVLVADVESGEKVREYKDCNDYSKHRYVSHGAWSPDGRLIAYSGFECGLFVREADTGVLVWKSTSTSPDNIEFSPDGRHLVGRVGLDLVVFSASDGKRQPAPEGSEHHNIFAFAPDGAFFAAAKDTEVRLYPLKGGAVRPAAAAAAPAAAPLPPPETVESVDAPPEAKPKVDPEAFAVVIGVERYRQSGIPKVDFAASDAKTVHAYLTRSMGFDPRNVVLLTDEQATKTDLEKYLGPWLENHVTAKSRVFLFYAGHGSPDPKSGDAYLMPYEADPSYTKVTGYPLKELYRTLASLPAKDIVVALDSCFSGAGQRSVIAAGARPLVNVKAAKPQGKAVVLAAAAADQISGAYPEGRHGLMTYFMLKGLRGAADADSDGAVTTRELFAFVGPEVQRQARKGNLEQTPQLEGVPAGAPGPVWVQLR